MPGRNFVLTHWNVGYFAQADLFRRRHVARHAPRSSHGITIGRKSHVRRSNQRINHVSRSGVDQQKIQPLPRRQHWPAVYYHASLGVVIVSHSDSHAVDLTSFLFGDILGVRPSDIFIIAIATVLGGLTIFLFHRQFTALAFDERKAHTLGLNPRLAHLLMLALIALATVVSFQVVGTLLVFGLLIGPPATAALLVQDKASISLIMIVASLLGCAEIYLGLLISWHASTAAGATITLLSAAIFFATLLTKSAISKLNFTA